MAEPLDFHANFWSLLFSFLAFAVTLYNIAAARTKASNQSMERLGGKLDAGREAQSSTNARMGERLQANETDIEALKRMFGDMVVVHNAQAATNGRFGERLQAVETAISNGIGHDDLKEIYKRMDDNFDRYNRRMDENFAAVTRRSDEAARIMSEIGSAVGRLAGTVETWKNQPPKT